MTSATGLFFMEEPSASHADQTVQIVPYAPGVITEELQNNAQDRMCLILQKMGHIFLHSLIYWRENNMEEICHGTTQQAGSRSFSSKS